MDIIKFILTKSTYNILNSIFSSNEDTKKLILISHILYEEKFEKVTNEKIYIIKNKLNLNISTFVPRHELCTITDNILSFKGINNYDVIYHAEKQGFNFKVIPNGFYNIKHHSNESFFNILSEFKTYKVVDDKYTHFIDKKLLLKFVNKEILDNFVHNMNSKSHTLKEGEQLILKLYNE